MILQERNYWLTTAEFPKTESRPLSARIDVAVIGAGFTGLSAARTLAKRGAKVAVFESETIGWGASSRNGGMVLTGMKLGVNKLISMYGRDLTRRMYAASLATIDCVEQIIREEAIDCDFSRCGHLEVAEESHRRPEAHRGSLDGGDDRLGKLEQIDDDLPRFHEYAISLGWRRLH